MDISALSMNLWYFTDNSDAPISVKTFEKDKQQQANHEEV